MQSGVQPTQFAAEIGKRDGQGLEKINLAACHNCCLVSRNVMRGI